MTSRLMPLRGLPSNATDVSASIFPIRNGRLVEELVLGYLCLSIDIIKGIIECLFVLQSYTECKVKNKQRHTQHTRNQIFIYIYIQNVSKNKATGTNTAAGSRSIK